jgi:hypothetical protein
MDLLGSLFSKGPGRTALTSVGGARSLARIRKRKCRSPSVPSNAAMWHDPWAMDGHGPELRAAGAEVKIRNPNDYVQVETSHWM